VTTGALAGAAGGAIMTGTLQGTLKGALFGAIGAGAAYGIGNALGHGGGSIFAKGFKPVKAFAKALAHGISRGAISMAQGGTFRSGFASGFAASFFSPGTELGGDGAGGFTLRTTIAGLVGGTASEIGGGKFANGAISGAFVHMFNAEGAIQKVGKYYVGKPESHNGGKLHVHWGESSNKRLNAVTVDGEVRHGNPPPNKVKKFINKTFGEFKIPNVTLLIPENVIQAAYINQATCGNYYCPKVY